jgi:hypothetical protein
MRITGGIAQKLTQSVDSCANAVLELNNCIVGPERLADRFPRNHLIGSFEQHAEDAKGLLGQANGICSVPMKLSGGEIQRKVLEPEYTVSAPLLLQHPTPWERAGLYHRF